MPYDERCVRCANVVRDSEATMLARRWRGSYTFSAGESSAVVDVFFVGAGVPAFSLSAIRSKPSGVGGCTVKIHVHLSIYLCRTKPSNRVVPSHLTLSYSPYSFVARTLKFCTW